MDEMEKKEVETEKIVEDNKIEENEEENKFEDIENSVNNIENDIKNDIENDVQNNVEDNLENIELSNNDEPVEENKEEKIEDKTPSYLKSEEEYEKFLNHNNEIENDPLIQYALSEFRYAKFIDDEGNYCDEIQEMMCKDVLEVLKLVSSQGHSGFSIGYFKNLFNKLINFEPLSPLTGNDNEWVKTGFGEMEFEMNVRDGRVVRYPDGHCEFRDGLIIKYPDGTQQKKSLVITSFPFVPKVEYIDYNDYINKF